MKFERLKALYGEEAVNHAIKRMSNQMAEGAKQMRIPPEVQGVCPHSMVGKYDDEYYCVDCKQRVYPDPDWFDKGFLLYGGK